MIIGKKQITFKRATVRQKTTCLIKQWKAKTWKIIKTFAIKQQKVQNLISSETSSKNERKIKKFQAKRTTVRVYHQQHSTYNIREFFSDKGNDTGWKENDAGRNKENQK